MDALSTAAAKRSMDNSHGDQGKAFRLYGLGSSPPAALLLQGSRALDKAIARIPESQDSPR